MDIKGFTANGLTGKTVSYLSRALDFRSANHNVISGNLANIDTPGFRPKELVFDKALQDAIDKNAMRPKATNPKHFSHLDGAVGNDRPTYEIISRAPLRSKTNQLNIDQEMSKMVQNNILYEASVRLLTKKLDALKTAIESGRR